MDTWRGEDGDLKLNFNNKTANIYGKNTCTEFYIQTWWLTDLNVTAHVFCDHNGAIILIFAVTELWLCRSYTWL